jgi:putative ABC transport system permease protein
MMFWRVLRGSLRYQRGRLAIATLAVLLGASLISALVNLSFNVSSQAGRELRAYGANLVLLPKGESVTEATSILGATTAERGIPEADLTTLDSVREVVGYAPYLYLVADIGGQPVVVGGTQFNRARAVSPWWQVKGQWPVRPEEGLVGASVARALGLAPGDQVTLAYGEATHMLTVAGVLQTGGPEDSQVLVPLKLAQTLSGQPGEVSMVQVSVLAGQRTVEEVAADIEARLPDVDARALRQFAQAEAEVLRRIRRLMALVAALVLAVAALTVGSTLITAVLERRAEIGLMKALGASDRRVAAFFLAEALSMGIAGGLLGYVAGLGMAAFIGQQVFQATLSPTPLGLPVTLGVATGVVLLASLWPVRQALAVDPATTLRGE